MADKKFSQQPLLSPLDLVSTDKIWVLDKSDTTDGPEGTIKQLPASALGGVTTLQSRVFGLATANLDFDLPLLQRIAQAINIQGTFTAPAGYAFVFKTSTFEYVGDPNAQDPEINITYMYFRLITGALSVGGGGLLDITASDLIIDGGPYVTNPTIDSDLFISLGDIGVGPIEDAFNNGDENGDAWFIEGERLVSASINGELLVWNFTGGNGSWGGDDLGIDPLVQEATAEMFDLLSNTENEVELNTQTVPEALVLGESLVVSLTNHEEKIYNRAAPLSEEVLKIGSKVLGGKSRVLITTEGLDDFTKVENYYSITVTGTSGTATLSIDGNEYTMTFDTDEDTTVAGFVAAEAAIILSETNVVATADGDILQLVVDVAVVVTFVNASGNLTGGFNEKNEAYLNVVAPFLRDTQYWMHLFYNGSSVEFWFTFFQRKKNDGSIFIGGNRFEYRPILGNESGIPVTGDKALNGWVSQNVFGVRLTYVSGDPTLFASWSVDVSE